MSTCYLGGYYQLKFSDYPALAGVIDDLAVMSILFYKGVSDSATYAVRVINIPEEEADTTVYARPYFIYEDAEGNEVIVYDDICSSTYNG